MSRPGRHTAQSSRHKPKPGLAARQLASEALHDIVTNHTMLDQALAAARKGDLPEADKALAHAITATALRHKGEIDDLLNRLLSKPLPPKSGLAREILWTGAAQILFMRVPPHAAIDLAVSTAKRDRAARHFAGLINAVLRKVSQQGNATAEHQDQARLNIPQWMFASWAKAYGPDTASEIARASLSEAPLDITPKSQPEIWAGRLGGQLLASGSIRLDSACGRIETLPGYDEGAWWVQDTAAALPVKLLGQIVGKRALDLCAAPGGKTAQLAAAGASVVALDSARRRLARLRGNLGRLQLSAEIVCADASVWNGERDFDVVVADIPCSATGTLRRHPEGLITKTPGLPGKLAKAQRAIIHNAIALARPGATIIVCSCSLQPQEAEDLISELLEADLPVARKPLQPGELFGWQHMIDANGDMRTLPCHSLGNAQGLDGFFASRLVRL